MAVKCSYCGQKAVEPESRKCGNCGADNTSDKMRKRNPLLSFGKRGSILAQMKPRTKPQPKPALAKNVKKTSRLQRAYKAWMSLGRKLRYSIALELIWASVVTIAVKVIWGLLESKEAKIGTVIIGVFVWACLVAILQMMIDFMDDDLDY